jgi:predicted RNA-binding Zn ribbon-like protein
VPFPDLVANAPCLELCNTINNWHDPQRDLLDSVTLTTAWAALLGTPLSAPPTPGQRRRARDLRASIREVFSAIAANVQAPGTALDAILRAHQRGLARAALHPSPPTPKRQPSETYEVTWPGPTTLDDVLAAAAASAVDLLEHGPLGRVGECPSCGWLYLDTSRNGRRRWCSMKTCGARDKARAYYDRRH